MISQDYPLSQKDFEYIYSKVPRLTVEIIIKNKDGYIFLTKRSIEPCKGQWHLPGGTVRFGELMIDAVRRIARRELSIEIKNSHNAGFIEYPSHFENGLDSPVGIVFEIESYSGEPKINNEAQNSGWFIKVPENMHADQKEYLLNSKYLSN